MTCCSVVVVVMITFRFRGMTFVCHRALSASIYNRKQQLPMPHTHTHLNCADCILHTRCLFMKHLCNQHLFTQAHEENNLGTDVNHVNGMHDGKT